MNDEVNRLTAGLRFDGQRVLVVGGSSGIGNGIAQAFRAAGARVHVWGTRPSAADYKDEPGSDLSGVEYAQVDVADNAAVVAAARSFERLDVLVLSQGIVAYRRAEFDDAGFQHVVNVNLSSVMRCCQQCHAALKAARGAVIVVSSVAAYKATIGNPAYAASKAGAVSLVRTLGVAWAGDGIRVNGIAPGLVATKLTRVTTDHPERLKASVARIPMRRVGTPQELAGAALFLASPLAAYVTGHTLPVDGGMTA
jgi:3-oxoacyl-[acyl-carrier protein] reductase